MRPLIRLGLALAAAMQLCLRRDAVRRLERLDHAARVRRAMTKTRPGR